MKAHHFLDEMRKAINTEKHILENTKRVGNLTELQCITYLYSLGYSISIPYGNADKYDIILDANNHLYKVQIKHAKEYFDKSDGELAYIKINCTWQSHNTNGYKRTKYVAENIDYFATYYKDKCYLIPVSECSTEKILRIKPSKNYQIQKVSMLEDYEAEKILKLSS